MRLRFENLDGVVWTMGHAGVLARQCKHARIDTEHLLWSLLDQPETILRPVFKGLDIDVGNLRQRIAAEVKKRPQTAVRQDEFIPQITPRVGRLLEDASKEASDLGDDHICDEHLLLAIIGGQQTLASQYLIDAGVTRGRFLEWLLQLRRQQDSSGHHYICQTAFWGPNGILRGLFHYPKLEQPASKGDFRWPGERQPKPRVRFPTVVLLHGFTGHHVEDHRLFVQFGRFLGDAGFCVLRFDFFGSGDSNGTFDQFTPLTEVADAVAALDWVSEQKWVDPDRIAVVGLSLGGCVTALLAGQDPRVKAAVFWNAVTLPDQHFNERVPTEGPFAGVIGGLRLGREFQTVFRALDIVGTLKKYTGPGLVIRGTADDHISQAEAEALHAALGDRGTLRLIEGADHTFRRPDWRQEVFEITARWLSEHL